MNLTTAINREKNKLISKANRRGLYENFGQTEVRKLQEQFIDSSDYSKEMNQKRNQIQAFDNWCMNYTG